MLFPNDLHLLITKRHDYDYKEFLLQYTKVIADTLYLDINSYYDLLQYLRHGIINYAKKYSKFYKNINNVVDKKSFDDSWKVDDIPYFHTYTGGTTGPRFHYRIWKEIYDAIERVNHYEMIIKEFKLFKNDIKILYVMLDQTVDHQLNQTALVYRSNNIIVSHGMLKKAIIHEIPANAVYFNNYYLFYEKLLNYATQNHIDVILAPSNIIAAIAWNVQRLDYRKPICQLLSNTGSQLDIKDVMNLQRMGCIQDWCDHMRCWDGGASFFTCFYNNYHLQDNLAYITTNDQDQLISDDYFSLPNPFINYWNGDYIKLENDYQKCRCGRLYRYFSISRTRDFGNIIDDQLSKNYDGIKRIDILGKFMRIITSNNLSREERTEIRLQNKNHLVNFIVESND